MSLKQRAVQCSGHIPADQYVPVYSSPHRTNQVRRLEEIVPLIPEPILEDPYSTRTLSTHEAVKQWLESSPNSVIGPLYKSRSPSSDSPPSNGELRATPARVGTPPWEHNMERLSDGGPGGLSPVKQMPSRQVSNEQSVGLSSGSLTLALGPVDQVDSSTPRKDTYMDKTRDSVRTPALLATQKGGFNGLERVLPRGDDGESRKANDAALQSMPQVSSAVSLPVLSWVEEASVQAKEGTNRLSSGRRVGKKRNIEELESPGQDRSYGLAEKSLAEFHSRAASREFDHLLALAVKEIEKMSAVDTLSSTCVSSLVGEPIILLKPPRGLEPQSARDDLTELSRLRRAASARGDHNSAVMATVPLSRAASAREVSNSVFTKFPLSHRAASIETTSGILAVAKAGPSNPEIVPANDPEIVENGFRAKESSSDIIEQKPLPFDLIKQKQTGSRATLKEIDESRLESWSGKQTSDPPRLTIKAVLEHRQNLSEHLGKTRSGNSLVTSNGIDLVAGGGLETRNRSSRRKKSSCSSGGSVISAANSVHSQHIYRVSPPHQMARISNRSKRRSANAVLPVELGQLTTKSDECTKSSWFRKSKKREADPTPIELEKGKFAEELRLKAQAWEKAKNDTIVNRYKWEENKLHAWEEPKVAKSTLMSSKVEADLEKKRARAMEKMHYEVAQARKKAEEMKAHAEAKRVERAAKAAVQAQVIRAPGKSPLACFCS